MKCKLIILGPMFMIPFLFVGCGSEDEIVEIQTASLCGISPTRFPYFSVPIWRSFLRNDMLFIVQSQDTICMVLS